MCAESREISKLFASAGYVNRMIWSCDCSISAVSGSLPERQNKTPKVCANIEARQVIPIYPPAATVAAPLSERAASLPEDRPTPDE